VGNFSSIRAKAVGLRYTLIVLLTASFVGLWASPSGEVPPVHAAQLATPSEVAEEQTHQPERLDPEIQLAPQPKRTTGLSPLWVVISASLAGAVLMMALLTHRRR